VQIDDKLLVKLFRLNDAASRKKFLARHRRLLSSEGIDALTAAVREQMRVDAHRALGLAEVALTAARQMRKPELKALAIRAKANALYASGRNKDAVALDECAAKIFEKKKNAAELGKTLLSSLQPLILVGEYDRASATANRAREIFLKLGDTHRLARLEINVGNIFHRQDRFAEALACYERAYDQLLAFKDAEGIAAALSNIAVCLISLDDFRRALATYKRAREYCEKNGMPVLTAQADYNIAYLHYLRGDYERAIEMLHTARETCRRFDDAYHFALCHLDLSDIYLELNLTEEAQEIAHEGFSRFRQLSMGYEAAKCLANEAIAISKLGKPFRALELFDQARTAFVREKNLVWPWLVDLYRALILFQEGRLYESRRLCRRALEFLETSSLRGKEILCRLLLARIHLKSGNYSSAKQECALCLAAMAKLDVPALEYQSNLLMGQIHQATGDLESAYHSYRKAREALENLRSGLRRDELKIAFVRNKLQVYENLVDLCLSGKVPHASLEEAFEYIEDAKSRSLRDLLLRHGDSSIANDSNQSALVRRIRDLREELDWYYHRIEDEQLRGQTTRSAQIERLEGQAIHKEKELLEVLREAPAGSIAPHAHKKVSVAEIRRVLPPDSVLIEYFSIDDRVLAIVLNKNQLEMTLVSVLARVRGLLQMLQFQLAKHRLNPKYVRLFQESFQEATLSHLCDLYGELIAPIRQSLAGQDLIIIPHGILHHVPFHALYDGSRYLIDSFTVSYSPSASIYASSVSPTFRAADSSLIFGVSDERAPFIRDEAESLAKLLPSPELFLNSGATLANLNARAPHARIIHIATHGDFRPDNPLFSRVHLGDSYLTLHDLYQLRLPAEIVTLSGCATGLNVVSTGDELLGLARGLFAAGAQSLLLSLWDVNDKSTTEFMQHFYRRLLGGDNKVRAMQHAVTQLREHYPHPYFWAPFLLVERAGI
jgi:CHAT domain-containing protein/Tfp pilus assembly protein PilF